MKKTDWINREYVEAFKKGDRVGLPFEGGTIFRQEREPQLDANSAELVEALMEVLDDCDQELKTRILSKWQEKRLQLALKSNQGSDESSIVDCFTTFVEGYSYTGREQFVWDWINYHQHHHGTGYGRTMRDHFAVVAHIRRHGDNYPDLNSKIRKLMEIAVDADSFGNASLALVYPAYCYAKTIDEDPSEFVRYLTGFTHAHPDAMEAVSRLCIFIEDPATIEEYFNDTGAENDEVFRQRFCRGHATASNTLVTAVKCAMKETEMDVISEAIRIGGDVDSVLATAMLVWELKHSIEGKHDRAH
jgi:ADP-ribosylglycohydrolase